MSSNTVKFPKELYEALVQEAKNKLVPVEVVIFHTLSAHIHNQTLVATRPAAATDVNLLEPGLPADIERSRSISGFRGVFPNGNRWRATYMGSTLGTYDTPAEAALVRHNERIAEKAASHAAVQQIFDAQADLPRSAPVQITPPGKSIATVARRKPANRLSEVAPVSLVEALEPQTAPQEQLQEQPQGIGLAAAQAARDAIAKMRD